MSRRLSRAAPLVGALLCFGAGAAFNARHFDDADKAFERGGPTSLALPETEFVKRASLGFRDVLADFYWMGSAHYFGDPRNDAMGYALLPHYARLVNELSPAFRPAYRFVGMAMPWRAGGKWHGVEETAQVLERAIRRYPDDWYLRLLLANIQATYQRKFREAATLLASAAPLPGAPPHIGPLATRMYVAADDVDSAEQFARDMLAETTDDSLREAMAKRARQLALEKALRTLNKASQEFASRTGAPPKDLKDLVRAGLLSALPEEPFGGVFLLDPATGRIDSSTERESLMPHVDKRFWD